MIEKNLYLGKIVIEEIDTEYPVFNEFNEELLKIAHCKFYGLNIGESDFLCKSLGKQTGFQTL